jgi:hypothetical protein
MGGALRDFHSVSAEDVILVVHPKGCVVRDHVMSAFGSSKGKGLVISSRSPEPRSVESTFEDKRRVMAHGHLRE